MLQRHSHPAYVSRLSFAILTVVMTLLGTNELVAQAPVAPTSSSSASRAELSLRARLGGLKSVSVMVRTGGDAGAGMFDKKAVRAQAEAARPSGRP